MVFVLLIGFIIIAPLLQLDEVELADAPAKYAESSQVAQASPVTIHVRSDNSIWWQGTSVTEDELFSLLKEAKEQHPDVVPQLFHDKRGFFGTYQSVKNALEAAGFERLDIILQPS